MGRTAGVAAEYCTAACGDKSSRVRAGRATWKSEWLSYEKKSCTAAPSATPSALSVSRREQRGRVCACRPANNAHGTEGDQPAALSPQACRCLSLNRTSTSTMRPWPSKWVPPATSTSPAIRRVGTLIRCVPGAARCSRLASARLWDGSRKDPTSWRVACPLPAQQRLLVTAVLAPHVVAAVHDQCPSHLAWEQVCDGDRCCPRDCKAVL